jgi:hypothetical protein
MALDDRIADVRPVRNVFPVGVQAAGRLAAALDDVAGQAAGSQQVEVGSGPAELVHQRPQRHRAVDAASGDHHLGTGRERGGDRQRAEIGVGAQHLLGQGFAAEHVLDAARAQGRHLRADVVALDHRDAQRDACRLGQRLQRGRASVRIDAARVADHLDALPLQFGEHRLHRDVDEVGGPAHLGLLGARRRKNGHRRFGQVVEHQVVEPAALHQLRRGHHAVAPEARGAADADDLAACHGDAA